MRKQLVAGSTRPPPAGEKILERFDLFRTFDKHAMVFERQDRIKTTWNFADLILQET